MAEKTGTLWENIGDYASCNHGFASHVAHALYRDVLGAYEINYQDKFIKLRLSDVGLLWCEGKIPTKDGPLTIRWKKEADTIKYNTQLPPGYKLTVETLPPIKAVPDY